MEDKYPLISTIIPTYNRAGVVTDAIDSVLNQTYKNIEIIVIDDGSTDNTKESLVSYGDKIRYFYKKNGGVSSARNYGIKESRGDYVAFLDSDDAWYPEKVEKQIAKTIEDKSYKAVFAEIESINAGNNCSSFFNLQECIEKDGYILEGILKSLSKKTQISCSYMLVKKDVFSEIGLFDESLDTAEDIDILLRICSRYQVALVREPLVKYIKREDSLSNKLFTQNRLKAIEKLKTYASDIYDKNSELISKILAKIHLSYAKDLLWNRCIKEARKQMMKSMRKHFTFKAGALYLKSWIIQFFLSGRGIDAI